MNMPGGDTNRPTPTGGNVVSISNFAFVPAVLTVHSGGTVSWTNGDEDPHTVAATGGPFRSPTLAIGGTYRYRFTKPGRYPYICTIHPFMHGTVVVSR